MPIKITRRPFRGDNEKFPTHFEDESLKIFTNTCHEVFITAKETGVTIRLSARDGGIEFTAFGYEVKPIVVAGSIGYRVEARPHP